jgi:hypothetical protein
MVRETVKLLKREKKLEEKPSVKKIKGIHNDLKHLVRHGQFFLI